ncbi:MAG: TlpA disulfide reductase family protein, partial [Candidatus Thermoplasmatota archaeon]
INPFKYGPGIGQTAPDFRHTSTDGATVQLTEMLSFDQPVLLEFMDVDCEYCQQEAGNVLRYLYQNYSNRVRFLSLDANFVGSPDTPDRIAAFKTTYGTPWPYALDDSGGTTRTYGVNSTPTTFIIDRNGVIVDKVVGAAPGGYGTYRDALDRALQV